MHRVSPVYEQNTSAYADEYDGGGGADGIRQAAAHRKEIEREDRDAERDTERKRDREREGERETKREKDTKRKREREREKRPWATPGGVLWCTR